MILAIADCECTICSVVYWDVEFGETNTLIIVFFYDVGSVEGTDRTA